MKAIIVGGGIGGLATAVALDQRGWQVEVLERAPAFTEAGAGLSLWPNALRALDRLGLGDTVRGRAVLTGWEALDPGDDRIPARIRQISFSTGLAGTGFTEVEVVDRSAWRERERTMWEEAAGLDPGSDPSLQSFHEEGVRVLQTFPLVRRVLAIAIAP